MYLKKNIRLKQWINGLLLQLIHFIRNRLLKESFWVVVNWRVYKIYTGNIRCIFRAFKDIFINDHYGIFDYSKKCKPSLIVDIGAHIGMFSKLCSILFPNTEILSYEPYPPSFEVLKKNTIRNTHINIFPYAVLDKSGLVMLDVDSSHPGSINVSPKGKLEVKSIAAVEIAKGRTIDLLKMDCEGSEWSILQDPDFLRRVKELRMEYHLEDNHTIEEVEAMIKKAGHRIVRNFLTPEIGERGILWSTNIFFS